MGDAHRANVTAARLVVTRLIYNIQTTRQNSTGAVDTYVSTFSLYVWSGRDPDL